MKKYVSPKVISLVFGILVICFAVGFYVFGWVEPSGDPPIGNVPVPLNTSGNAQIKTGMLFLGTGISDETNPGLIVANGRVGIGDFFPTYKPDAKLDIRIDPTSTNTVEEMIRLTRTSQGVVEAGMGSSIDFWLEPDTPLGVTELTGKIANVLVGTADLDADLVFYTWSGATLNEALRLHQSMVSGGHFVIDSLVVDAVDQTLIVDKEKNSVGIGTSLPKSRLQVDNGYLQIDVTFAAPPPEDCGTIDKLGRMILMTGANSKLYVCGATGWVAAELNP